MVDPTFKSLVKIVESQPSALISIDSQVYSHSKIQKLSGNCLAMLAISKFNVLWLIDITNGDTIKIMSTHSKNTNHTPNIAEAVIMADDSGFISGANDGCLKFTSLNNL